MRRNITDPVVRFWRHVNRTNDCWVWTGGHDQKGYGAFVVGRRGSPHVKAHRFSWELSNAPIPAGLLVCHRCDNPPCVNPEHLFLGTPAENSADMKAKGRQHKPHRKLTEPSVVAIRLAIRAGRKKADIAREYGVSRATIRAIGERRTWAKAS